MSRECRKNGSVAFNMHDYTLLLLPQMIMMMMTMMMMMMLAHKYLMKATTVEQIYVTSGAMT